MKRKLSLLLALVMLFGAVPQVQAEEESPEYALSLNFNQDQEGGQPGGFEYLSTGNNDEILVADVPGNGNKSVRIQSTAFTNSVMHYVPPSGFFDGKTNAVVEFELMIEKYGQGSGYFSIHTANTVNKVSYNIFLAKADETGNLSVGEKTNIQKLMTGKFYKIAVSINIPSKTADVYVNHKLAAEDVYMGDNFSYMGSYVRVNIDNCTEGTENPIYYFDNFSIYAASAPEFVLNKSFTGDSAQASGGQSLMEKYMNGTVCFYINQDTYAVNGKVEKLDESNENVKTIVSGGTSSVPANVLCDALSLSLEQTDETLTISKSDKSLTLDNGEYSVYEEVLYVPVRKVSEYFGHKVSYDKSGLIVVGDKENHFKLDTSDVSFFRELTYAMCCDAPTADEIYTDIKGNNLSRPRIILNENLLTNLKNNINTYPQIKKWYESIKKKADKVMKGSKLSYKADSYAGILAISQEARTRIPQLAIVYLVEGDESYAQRAVEEMLSISEFPDFYPYRALDTAEMNLALGIGYDWLYSYMTAEQRTKIKTALVEKGLKMVLEDYTGEYTYKNESGRSRSSYFTQLGDKPHNWVYVCNGGAIAGALSIADEEPQLSSEIISYALENWGKALRFLAPDGVHYEGPMYNNWMLVCMTNAFSSLENTFGTTYGLMDMPGVTEFPYANAAFISTVSPFNFGNAEPSYGNTNSNGTFYMASYANDVALGQLRSYAIDTYNMGIGVQDLIYAKPEYLNAGASSVKDNIYSNPGSYSMLTLRSDPVHKNAINLAATAALCQTYEQADMGSFIIDAYGTRFAHDMGKGVYEGTWFDKYKHRAEGHNVIVINPDQSPGFKTGTVASLDNFVSDKDEGFAIYDLSANYKDYATSAKRGYYLIDNRSRIVIQDEIKCENPSEMYWFMHTGCEIELSEDKKSAILKGDMKNMHLRIDCNIDAEFSVMEAKLLETSPQSDKSNNDKYKKLAIHLKDVTDLSLAVVMDFEYPYVEFNKPMPQKQELAAWKLSEDKAVTSPSLEMIYLNGAPLPEFDKGTYSYKCILPSGAAVPTVTASGLGKVEVKNISTLPATSIITVTDENGNSAEYGIVIEHAKEIVRPEIPLNNHDKEALPVYIVSASQIYQEENIPEHMVDGNIATRWVGTGEQFVDFDLGSIRNINAVSMSIYGASDDGRQQMFDILVSEDGINWKEVLTDTNTSGKSDNAEKFSFEASKGMYVRLKFYGNSVNTYDSITEVRIFGE